MSTAPKSMLSIKRAGAALSVLLLSSGGFSLSAQLLKPREPMPSFEVVSIKPLRPAAVTSPAGAGSPRKKVVPAGTPAPVDDRVHFTGQIELLIEAAYGLPLESNNRVLGAPDWVQTESDRYEVIAKIADAHYAAMRKMSPAQQREEVSLMEQSLLTDRFKFRAHIDTKEMPRYVLVVAKGGSKLKRAQDGDKTELSFVQNGQENELRAIAVSIEELVRSPFVRIDRNLIVDKTDLQGRFSFTLKFRDNPNPDIGRIDDAPLLPTALQEQLGLRVVRENGPVEIIVIDYIERPSEN